MRLKVPEAAAGKRRRRHRCCSCTRITSCLLDGERRWGAGRWKEGQLSLACGITCQYMLPAKEANAAAHRMPRLKRIKLCHNNFAHASQDAVWGDAVECGMQHVALHNCN